VFDFLLLSAAPLQPKPERCRGQIATKSDFPCSIVRPTAASAIAGFSLSALESGRSFAAPADPPHKSVGRTNAKIYKTVEEDA
jgi:hypothetical protein